MHSGAFGVYGHAMDIFCTVKDGVVYAVVGGEQAGRISVPDIDFHWCDGVYVKMEGIAGVGTDERFRRTGIAGKMMAAARSFAVHKGYTCSGISTNLGNNARRLYSRAGYTTLFRPGRYEKRLGPPGPPDFGGIEVRGYREGDEKALIRLFEEMHRPFFGLRKKTAERWQALRAEVRGQDPDFLVIAGDGGEISGWAGYFKQWVGLVSEVWVRPCDRRDEIAQALLLLHEAHLLSRGIEKAHFWASPDDRFTSGLLVRNGYTYAEMRVFMLSILDLQGLLEALLPLFRRRAGGGLPWRGAVKFEASGQQGALAVGDGVDVTEGEEFDVEVATLHGVMERVMAGVLSPWEAYLEGLLTVRPGMTPEIRALLETLFPKAPVFHPADDMW